jgi:hypothetical protein
MEEEPAAQRSVSACAALAADVTLAARALPAAFTLSAAHERAFEAAYSSSMTQDELLRVIDTEADDVFSCLRSLGPEGRAAAGVALSRLVSSVSPEEFARLAALVMPRPSEGWRQ